jgi:hypothetical protein
VTATYYTYSGNDYTAGTAGATDFPLVSSAAKTISYLQPSHIHVYTSINQGASWTELSRPSQWDFVSSGTVARLAAGIASGTWVRVKRITPNDGTYVTFQSGSLLTAEQLNDEASSNSFVNQETSDLLSTTLSEVQAAQQAIESAIAVVGGLTAFAQVANVAAIPAAPANGTAVEVANSTGIESFSPLTGLPPGFVGDAGLTARIIYNSATTSWVWFGYGVKEPDARYARLTGATFTGAIVGTSATFTGQARFSNTANASAPSISFDGDTDTGLYRTGANELGVAVGGQNAVSIDASRNITMANNQTVQGSLTVQGVINGTLAGGVGVSLGLAVALS